MAEFLLSFVDIDLAARNQLAADLAIELTEDLPEAQVQQVQADEGNQDFGATLLIILSSPAIIALTKGVVSWLARHHNSKLKIQRKFPDGRVEEIELDGLNFNQAEAIIKLKPFETESR